VRVVRREAERSVDPLLQLLRDDVLEALGLVVHVVDVQPERLGEVELQETVVADHLERDLLAGRRQRDAAVRLVHRQAERGELLHHRARRRRRHSLAFCERRHRDASVVGAELVDLAQIVLNRVG
jgi:hypothetical protein